MKKNNMTFFWITIIVLFVIYLLSMNDGGDVVTDSLTAKDTFKILASTSTKAMDDDLIKYGVDNGFNVEIEHYGDLEIVDILNDNSIDYDALWISNSIWLYMLDNSYLVTDSKSIVIDPVVMGINKSKAEELGLVNKEINNSDLLNIIRDGKLKYVMSSVTKTNTGATTYLSFLNSLAGSPEVLTESNLKEEKLANDLKDFFKGVERVSGDEDYLKNIYLKGDYNAMIDYESSLIKLNKELIKKKKEPLYLIYPKDGVAINDMPFGYINNDANDDINKERFIKLQSYLRSDKMISKMEKLGYRSWYGGTKNNTDKKIFNPDWGIDTSKYLKDMKYPSKKVITEAINLYIEKLRKPTHVVFCLDTSGSMYGEGLKELKEAMNYILDFDLASRDKLQFSDKDKITVITFSSKTDKIFETRYGNDTNKVIDDIKSLYANGGTNIYSPSVEGLKILAKDNDDEYTKTIILMTDGYSNNGSFYDLKNYYNKNKSNVPIYSITFGSSDENELARIADLTNGKVFDGKSGLKQAFGEVRSYN
ncbi:MAG: VWA domain-containing protein [Bacilli bacterium]|nr:VWA domain-containing protein [Bacilli bacterium]